MTWANIFHKHCNDSLSIQQNTVSNESKQELNKLKCKMNLLGVSYREIDETSMVVSDPSTGTERVYECIDHTLAMSKPFDLMEVLPDSSLIIGYTCNFPENLLRKSSILHEGLYKHYIYPVKGKDSKYRFMVDVGAFYGIVDENFNIIVPIKYEGMEAYMTDIGAVYVSLKGGMPYSIKYARLHEIYDENGRRLRIPFHPKRVNDVIIGKDCIILKNHETWSITYFKGHKLRLKIHAVSIDRTNKMLKINTKSGSYEFELAKEIRHKNID